MGMAIPSVLNVIVMCMIIMAMFAILAVNLFSGRMNRCYNPAGWEVYHIILYNCQGSISVLICYWVDHNTAYPNIYVD